MDLFISPHLDDAVWSVPWSILSADQPVVATVFDRGAPGDSARHDEDRRALALLSAAPRHLGLLDGPWRGHHGLSGLIGVPAPEHDVARVEAEVAALITELRPRICWGPLGIGGHIDHDAVSRALIRLAPRFPEVELRLWADRPYSHPTGASEDRWKKLGFRPQAPVGTLRTAKASWDAPWNKRFRRNFAEGLIVALTRTASSTGPLAPNPVVVEVPEEALGVMSDAVGAYRSGLAGFVDELEIFWDRCRGPYAGVVEQWWSLPFQRHR